MSLLRPWEARPWEYLDMLSKEFGDLFSCSVFNIDAGEEKCRIVCNQRFLH